MAAPRVPRPAQPPLRRSDQVNVMLRPEVTAALDAYAEGESLTRTSAVRFIVTDWLRTHCLLKSGYPKPTGPATDAVDTMDAAIEEHRAGRKR